MMNKELSIQQVSAITGLSIHTLRYYERLGLLASTRIRRLSNGHRRYSKVDLEWIDARQMFTQNCYAHGFNAALCRNNTARRINGERATQVTRSSPAQIIAGPASNAADMSHHRDKNRPLPFA
jgi:DNA-binding transcriptional MerR regulator